MALRIMGSPAESPTAMMTNKSVFEGALVSVPIPRKLFEGVVVTKLCTNGTLVRRTLRLSKNRLTIYITSGSDILYSMRQNTKKGIRTLNTTAHAVMIGLSGGHTNKAATTEKSHRKSAHDNLRESPIDIATIDRIEMGLNPQTIHSGYQAQRQQGHNLHLRILQPFKIDSTQCASILYRTPQKCLNLVFLNEHDRDEYMNALFEIVKSFAPLKMEAASAMACIPIPRKLTEGIEIFHIIKRHDERGSNNGGKKKQKCERVVQERRLLRISPDRLTIYISVPSTTTTNATNHSIIKKDEKKTNQNSATNDVTGDTKKIKRVGSKVTYTAKKQYQKLKSGKRKSDLEIAIDLGSIDGIDRGVLTSIQMERPDSTGSGAALIQTRKIGNERIVMQTPKTSKTVRNDKNTIKSSAEMPLPPPLSDINAVDNVSKSSKAMALTRQLQHNYNNYSKKLIAHLKKIFQEKENSPNTTETLGLPSTPDTVSSSMSATPDRIMKRRGVGNRMIIEQRGFLPTSPQRQSFPKPATTDMNTLQQQQLQQQRTLTIRYCNTNNNSQHQRNTQIAIPSRYDYIDFIEALDNLIGAYHCGATNVFARNNSGRGGSVKRMLFGWKTNEEEREGVGGDVTVQSTDCVAMAASMIRF